MRAVLRISLAVLATGLCQCGTVLPPEADAIAETESVAVVYSDNNLTLALHNRGAETTFGQSANTSIKIATNEDLSGLLAGLAHKDFFANSTPTASALAKASMTVHRNGETHTWSRLPFTEATKTQFTHFQECVQLFRYVFDRTESFQAGTSKDFDTKTREMLENAKQQALQRGRK